MKPVLWLFLMMILLIIELLTSTLTTIWFAGGALAAFLAALFGLSLPLQWGVFVAVAVILLASTRPLAVRILNRRTVRTNVDSLIGKVGIVTEPIDNRQSTGMIVVDGISWTARCADERVTLPVGETVRVECVSGVKAIVSAQRGEP